MALGTRKRIPQTCKVLNSTRWKKQDIEQWEKRRDQLMKLEKTAPLAQGNQSDDQINYNNDCVNFEQNNEKVQAALDWYKYGFNVIPVVGKTTVTQWDPWLDNLSDESIESHWSKNPKHDIGFITNDSLLVLDADREESIKCLQALENTFDIEPLLIVKTEQGEHHYFRRAENTLANVKGYNSEIAPHAIDIKTGRSMVVLPPSENKTILINETDSIDDLNEVEQDFIDAVYINNGDKPPTHKPDVKTQTTPHGKPCKDEVRELLTHIDSETHYDDWNTVLMALHHWDQGGQDGLELAIEWSRKAENADTIEDITRKYQTAYKRTTGNVATVGKLYYLAGIATTAEIKAKYSNQNIIEQFEHLPQDGDPFFDDAVITPDMIMNPPPKRKHIIDGFLPEKITGIIAGAGGVVEPFNTSDGYRINYWNAIFWFKCARA